MTEPLIAEPSTPSYSYSTLPQEEESSEEYDPQANDQTAKSPSDSGSCCSRFLKSSWLVLAVALVAYFCDDILVSISMPFMPKLLGQMGYGPNTVGLYFSSRSLAVIVFTLPLGRATDKFGPRVVTLIGTFILTLCSIGLALGRVFWLLILCRIVSGISHCLIVNGFSTFVSLSFQDAAMRKRAMSILITSIGLAAALGPPVGGSLFVVGGQIAPYLFVCGFAVVAFLLNALLLNTASRICRQRQEFAYSKHILAGPVDCHSFCSVIADPYVILCAVASFIANFPLALFEPLLSRYGDQQLGLNPQQIGGLFALCSAVPILVAAPLAGWLTGLRWRWLVLFLAGIIIGGLMPVPVSRPLVGVLVAGGVLISLCVGAGLGLYPSLTSDVVKARHGIDRFGVGFAVTDLSVAIAWAVGNLFYIPAPQPYLITTVVAGAIVLFLSLFLPCLYRVRDIHLQEPPDADA